jgi:hypothetical protein
MKKYLGIPALATLTTLAALAVTGCGTPTSPAAVTTPDAQQLASCQYANNNCPLGVSIHGGEVGVTRRAGCLNL